MFHLLNNFFYEIYKLFKIQNIKRSFFLKETDNQKYFKGHTLDIPALAGFPSELFCIHLINFLFHNGNILFLPS